MTLGDILSATAALAMLYGGYRVLLHVWQDEGEHRREDRVVPIEPRHKRRDSALTNGEAGDLFVAWVCVVAVLVILIGGI